MKTHKLFLLFLFIAISFFPLQAKKVSIENAETVAMQYAKSNSTTTRSAAKPILVHTEFAESATGLRSLSADNEEAIYYVFSIGDNQGFVIVSADDIVIPVLGYTNTGDYDETALPPNFASWMEGLSQEIVYSIKNKIQQTANTQKLWNNYLSGNIASTRAASAVSPLVATRWNQGSPYNEFCPDGSFTGCVATAMAQIMKYHNYPDNRTATIPGYTTTKNGYVIENIPSTTYNWNAMTNTYSASSTSTEKTAVATLMYHCGASVKMDYTPTGSGAYTQDVGTALCDYFRYDKSIQWKARTYYNDTDWENILLSEINSGRPVLYSGRNESSGHAFVCDGYDDSGKFHFNWGWGGYCDGYYVTTALNPGTGGAGSGAGTYNENQEILINIKPDAGGTQIPDIRLYSNTNITSTKTTVDKGELFTVNAPVTNAGLFRFIGQGGVALVDANDQIIAIIGQYPLDLKYGSGSPYSINCNVPTSVSAGNYYLRAVSKSSDASSWTIAPGAIGYADKLAITITGNIRTHGMKIYGTPLSSTATSVNRGEAFTTKAQFMNAGTSTFSGDLGIALVNNNDDILEVIGTFRTNASLSAGSYWLNPFSASCTVSTAISAGNYKIRAVAKPTGENWSIIYGETGVTDILSLTVTIPATTWNPQNSSTDWTLASNWTNGVPGTTTKVTIPKSSSYPILTTNTTIDIIYFEAGAELGRQDLLTYQKAFVDYNFGTGNRSTHFRMLSLPLMEAYPGDYTFGGQPNTYVQTLGTDGTGKGKWVTVAGGNTTAFTAGTGFVLSIDPDKAPDKGLGLSGGILRLPYFDIDSKVNLQVHPSHAYNAETSTFSNPYGSGSYNVSRTENGYRIAGANVSVNPKFGQSGSSFLALVGNPFMSTIDFAQLQSENSSLIKNSYQIWTKVGDQVGYAGYSPDGNWGIEMTPGLDNRIAPLQGFVVEKNNSGTGSLNFDLVNITAGTQGILRNAVELGNKLDIVAQNDNASVRTFIAKREGGSVQFTDRDARKLIHSLTSIPEIYTLKPSKNDLVPVGMNIVDCNDIEYPLGIATSFNGDIKLTFSGMDDYDAQIFFVDKLLNKKIELTGLNNYEYIFNYLPTKEGDVIAATNDRFYLRTISQTSAITSSKLDNAQSLVIYAEHDIIHAISNESNLIREFSIYNLGGMLIYQSGTNAISHVNSKSLESGIYIVRVKTDTGVVHKKIIINH